MKTDQLSNMAAQGGIITIGFLDQMRGETVINPFVKPQAFATFGSPAPENKKKLGENISESFYNLLERWDAISNSYEDMDISDARKKWIMPLLRELGFYPIFNREDVMVDGDEHLRFKLSHRGWVSPDAPMIHTVAPKQDLEIRPNDGKGSKRSPHDEMQTFLNVSKDHKWGIVTNGISFRILRDFFHTTTKGYVEFDIENIMRERSYSDFRAFYRMVHASRFRGDGDNGDYPLEQFYKESVTAGEKVGSNLRGNVKKAIEVFGNGFLTLAPELTEQMIEDKELCKDYYNEILRVIYRILFLLYAEQRAMLPTRDSLYIEEYSITRLRKIAESRKGNDDHCDLWEGLKITFWMLAEGCKPLNVFAYNGSLFDKYEIPTIRKLAIKNHDLLEAIRCLTLFEEEHMLKRINYLDLDAEEIGSIYESLLDYTPRVLPSAMEIDGRTIPANEFFLDPRGSARKTTGSYYTDKRLVDELIKTALKPVAERKMAESEDKEAAILSLNVCDPACGSGAFLIAATNYLGKELAKARTGQSEPPDKHIRRARRDVLQHCIYGVDLNPMVVELAKVSLWIDAAVNDLPLNFLNHHIKCGNSLIGATPELIEKGIPDEAFNPVEGDDRKVAKEIKSKNKKEKKQRTLDEFGLEKEPTWAYEYAKLSHAEENDVDSVKWKQECYRAIVESPKRQHKKLVADAWCAAFFWQLNRAAPPPPTEATLRTMQKEMADGCVDPDTQSMILELAEEHRFFHWHLEFPDVFEGGEGGFDCVLGNPPWERINLEEKEFFNELSPDIAKAKTASLRKNLIMELKIKNSKLFQIYHNEFMRTTLFIKFIKNSEKFKYSSKGKLNTYGLFTEKLLSLLNSGGMVGMIVPTGLVTDDNMKLLFQYILNNNFMASLIDFENRKGIFPEVHRSYKFSLLTLCSGIGSLFAPTFSFFVTDPDEIYDESRQLKLSMSDISLINPNTKTCPVFIHQRDYHITKQIYLRIPILIDESGENPWNIEIHRMFNTSSDSHLFKPLEDLPKGRERIFIPFYEGKMIFQYNHRFATYKGATRENINQGKLPEINVDELADLHYIIEHRFYVAKKDILFKLKNKIYRQWFLSFRDITNNRAERTSIFSVIPFSASGNELPIIFSQNKDFKKLILLFANFNSFIFDYVSRQKIGGNHLNMFILKQLPVIPPSAYTTKLVDIITSKVLELTYTSNDLKFFACDFDYNGPPFKWNEERRLQIRCELDAIYAHLYGVSKEDLDYILESFPIVKRKDIKKYGEYRIKRLILDYFDKYESKIGGD